MKEKAILATAGLLLAGCAHQQGGGYGGYGMSQTGEAASTYTQTEREVADPSMNTTEMISRGAYNQPLPPHPLDPPTALEYDPAFDPDTEIGVEVNFSGKGGLDPQWERRGDGDLPEFQEADSSERGSWMGDWRQRRRFNESEPPVRDPINRRYEADSSERGASMPTRTEWYAPYGKTDRNRRDDWHEWDWNRGYDASERRDWEGYGRPGASRFDSGYSEEHWTRETPENTVGITTEEPAWLYRSNPAHGIGSATPPPRGAGAAAMRERGWDQRDFEQQDRFQDDLRFGAERMRYREQQRGFEQQDRPQRGDRSLARRVKRRLVVESTGTHGMMRHQVARNVRVSANNGVVTLRGTVPSRQDKNLIAIRAGEVSGVNLVRNELVIRPERAPENWGPQRFE